MRPTRRSSPSSPRLQRDYTGRPSPLTEAPTFAEHCGGARVLLKREDLNHTGSHKINNVLGQALLTKRMGKTRVIAETGAGQHGVATATAAALLGLTCTVYMGEEDTRRQALNVARMRLLGAEVVPVTTGSRTLKDAINEAFRDWVTNVETTHYLFGTVAGPHPFPTMVRDFQRVIGDEARAQVLEPERPAARRRPAPASAAARTRSASSPPSSPTPTCALVGLEAGGDGVETGRHAATITGGDAGRAARRAAPTCCRTRTARPSSRTRSPPGSTTRASAPSTPTCTTPAAPSTEPVTDAEAMEAFALLCRDRGHHPGDRVARTRWPGPCDGRRASSAPDALLLVNLSGRGDKDVDTARRAGSAWVARPPTAVPAEAEPVASPPSGGRRRRRRGAVAATSRRRRGEPATRSTPRPAQQGRAALIGYLPVGYPDVDGSIAAMTAAGRGAAPTSSRSACPTPTRSWTGR